MTERLYYTCDETEMRALVVSCQSEADGRYAIEAAGSRPIAAGLAVLLLKAWWREATASCTLSRNRCRLERWRFGWMRLPGVCTRGCTQRDI